MCVSVLDCPALFIAPLLGAALSVLVAAAAGRAQGFYYKEIAKDGRIYVFNIAANAERFEKTGEMGIGITKPGVGPNGETVVGDNERALQLYFFKHGISEAVPEPVAAGADDRLARRQDAHHDRQRLSRDLEPRAGAVHRGDPRRQHAARRHAAPRAIARPSFRIRRAKFKLEGWMIKPWLTYETQLNFPALTGAERRRAPRGRGVRHRLLEGQRHCSACTSASSSRRTARRR